jgi:hypothetical protein
MRSNEMIRFDLLTPFVFTLTSDELHQVRTQVLNCMSWYEANKSWFAKKLGTVCNLTREQVVTLFPAWKYLEVHAAGNLDIKYDFRKRQIDFFEYKNTPVGFMTCCETAFLIALEDAEVNFEILEQNPERLAEHPRENRYVSKGWISLKQGNVVYVKPHTYLYSTQPTNYMVLMVSPEFDRCIWFFQIPKYDPVFTSDPE